MGSRSVSSRARNSGEEKRAEELEKMPPADILVLSALLTNINRLDSVLSQLTSRRKCNKEERLCQERRDSARLVWTEPL